MKILFGARCSLHPVRVNIITLLMGAPLVELQVIDSFYLLRLYLWSSMLAIRCLEDIPTIVGTVV